MTQDMSFRSPLMLVVIVTGTRNAAGAFVGPMNISPSYTPTASGAVYVTVK